MSDDGAIRVERVSKTFKLPHEKQSSLKGALINFHKRGYETQRVLDDVSFEIKKGEFFGIVGRNGSGKSTLLKLISGIYTPTKGSIEINGKLTPFIELGVGFNPELTGRENVFLNGALLGFNRKEMLAMYDEIVEFAELERFMDQKLKNYSSGMQVRLAFSIAIRANTDILVLDEVLAVGDASFQKKCYDFFSELKEKSKTVVLVTHDMGAVRTYCSSAVLIDKGRIAYAGDAESVAQAYQRIFSVPTRKSETQAERWGSGEMRINSAQVEVHNKEIVLTHELKANHDIVKPIVGFQVFDNRGNNIFESNTEKVQVDMGKVSSKKTCQITWSFPNLFATGNYTVNVAVCDKTKTVFYDWVNNAASFEIIRESQTAGLIEPEVLIKKRVYDK
ncbi:hypothetical protein BH09PAT4_BH09PAT4_03120 [soil metagenome]